MHLIELINLIKLYWQKSDGAGIDCLLSSPFEQQNCKKNPHWMRSRLTYSINNYFAAHRHYEVNTSMLQVSESLTARSKRETYIANQIRKPYPSHFSQANVVPVGNHYGKYDAHNGLFNQYWTMRVTVMSFHKVAVTSSGSIKGIVLLKWRGRTVRAPP